MDDKHGLGRAVFTSFRDILGFSALDGLCQQLLSLVRLSPEFIPVSPSLLESGLLLLAPLFYPLFYTL